VFNLENIYTLTKTHNHSDWGCLYKAGDLSLIKLVAYHYFIKGIQDSLECDNENKCAIHFISHALVCDILCRTLECVIWDVFTYVPFPLILSVKVVYMKHINVHFTTHLCT